MRFHIFQETRQGARHMNQDRVGYLYTKESMLLVVCDGMGGHHRGEVAAEFTVHYLAKAFRKLAQPRLEDPAQFLFKYVHAAHEALIRYATKEAMHEVPRTTCVAAIVQDGKAYWSNVGDSRLYLIRDGVIHARTKDHSRVQSLMDAGKITVEQAAVHPERNKIFNCIGQPTPPRVDVQKGLALRLNDVMLLATDGLWGPIPMQFVGTTLSRSPMSVGVPMLLDLSEAVSGRECDNLSGVAMQWIGQEGAQETENIVAEERMVNDEDIALALSVLRGGMLGKSALA